MKEFEPRPFQKEVFERLKEVDVPPIIFPPRRYRHPFIGVDIGTEEGDKSVVVHGIPDKKGGFTVIAIDEFATFPTYKWWRNPIKWWNWRKLTRKWKKDSKFFEFRSTPPSKNKFKDMVEGRGKYE